MAVEIRVPRLGWSMEEGTFVEWLKRDGEQVRAGEPLFALEGDKAIQEIEAIGAGVLRISPQSPQAGETVKVGALVAVLVASGETASFAAEKAIVTTPAAISIASSVAPAVIASQDAAKGPTRSRESRVVGPKVSPRAARVAAELDVDWRDVPGTGGEGRVRERDVRAWAGQQGRDSDLPAAASSRTNARTSRTPSSFRKTIGARMVESVERTAPVTLTTMADATNLVSLRAQFKTAGATSDNPVPNFTDIMIKLAGRALQQHPALNGQWMDGNVVAPEGIHIAFAVDTPAGLVAPVVRDVPSLGLRQIAARTAELSDRARAARLQAHELGGGTFTVSNLGSFGIDAFTPIVNLPQCAILGIGRIDRRPAVVREEIVPRDLMTLSLTFDHRIVDGAPAARFLASLREGVENPGPWLLF